MSFTPQGDDKAEAQQRPESPKTNENARRRSGNLETTGVSGVVFAIICLVLEVIVFIFTVVGTPIDAFKSKTKGSSRSCYSMWGSKVCGSHKTSSGVPYKGFPTKGIRTTMNGAAAFAIISIFVTLVTVVLTVLLACKCVSRVAPGILSVIAFITLLIVWACQAGVYNRKYTIHTAEGVAVNAHIKDGYNYAGSFGLFVTAWCLQTIEMVLVFFADVSR